MTSEAQASNAAGAASNENDATALQLEGATIGDVEGISGNMEEQGAVGGTGNNKEASPTRANATAFVPDDYSREYNEMCNKYKMQCVETKRPVCWFIEHFLHHKQLEKQNDHLEEVIQHWIQECNSVRESFRKFRSEKSARCEQFERRALNLEMQLMTTTQRSQARELHHQQQLEQSNEKWEEKLSQLTKRAERAEEEKDNAVCRYASREAEVMRLQAQLHQLQEEKNKLAAEKNAVLKSTKFENVENLVSVFLVITVRRFWEERGQAILAQERMHFELQKNSLAQVEKQLADEKRAYIECEEECRETYKRLEANQTAQTELRSRLECVQSQLAQEQAEKKMCKEKLKRAQISLKAMEQQCAEEADIARKQRRELEEQYKNVYEELTHLRLSIIQFFLFNVIFLLSS
ncbi:unnamed protein product [Gongylonema pulchrum]|uniref:Uncharacterized protein n=1 Tax=Gongylonema pulchrum TaxID=637853 RepID=A0A183EDJ2_9BILA|nr:unnamed protein product [Gongylonema pulchrum]